MYKNFQDFLFESEGPLTQGQKDFLDSCVSFGGSWSWNPATQKVDVKGTFRIINRDASLEEMGIELGLVDGSFGMQFNRVAKDLKGCPEEITGDFNAGDCKGLETLVGGPKRVGGYYDVMYVPLKNLDGAPEEVVGEFEINSKGLENIRGMRHMRCGSFNIDTWQGTVANETKNWDFLVDLTPFAEKCSILKYHFKDWNGKGWADLIEKRDELRGTEKLIVETFLSPENLQRHIDENPEEMAIKLQSGLSRIRKCPEYETLSFGASDLEDAADDLSGLSDLGF